MPCSGAWWHIDCLGWAEDFCINPFLMFRDAHIITDSIFVFTLHSLLVFNFKFLSLLSCSASLNKCCVSFVLAVLISRHVHVSVLRSYIPGLYNYYLHTYAIGQYKMKSVRDKIIFFCPIIVITIFESAKVNFWQLIVRETSAVATWFILPVALQ